MQDTWKYVKRSTSRSFCDLVILSCCGVSTVSTILLIIVFDSYSFAPLSPPDGVFLAEQGDFVLNEKVSLLLTFVRTLENEHFGTNWRKKLTQKYAIVMA